MTKPYLNKVCIRKSLTENLYDVCGFTDIMFSYGMIIFHKCQSEEECQIWCDIRGYDVENPDELYDICNKEKLRKS